LKIITGSNFWVDGQFMKRRIGGIARDTQEIMGEMLGDVDYKVIKGPKGGFGNSKVFWKIFTLAQILTNQRLVLPSKFKGTLYQPQLGPLLPGSGIDQWIVRLHDIFPVTNPEWFRKIDSIQFKRSLTCALERQAFFLCNSASTQKSLLEYSKGYNVNSRVRLCKTPTFSDQPCGTCMACKFIKTNSLQKNLFLSVGTIEPRKNYKFALKFWKSRFDGKYILIVVGRRGWKSAYLQLRLRRNRGGVFWFPDVCDGTLRALYLKSAAYISFSLNEGFDLPAMEASSLGIPLILSDIPVHRELHGRSALFYRTPNELEFKIKTVIKNSNILF